MCFRCISAQVRFMYPQPWNSNKSLSLGTTTGIGALRFDALCQCQMRQKRCCNTITLNVSRLLASKEALIWKMVETLLVNDRNLREIYASYCWEHFKQLSIILINNNNFHWSCFTDGWLQPYESFERFKLTNLFWGLLSGVWHKLSPFVSYY